MAVKPKTVVLEIEEQAWMDFRVLALRTEKTVAGLLVEQVYRALSDAAFEVNNN